MYWGTFDISSMLFAARFGFKVASEQAAGILSQVKISDSVKCVMGETSVIAAYHSWLVTQD